MTPDPARQGRPGHCLPCPLCGEKGGLPVLHRADFPLVTAPVSASDKARLLAAAPPSGPVWDLTVLACQACAHCRLAQSPPSEELERLYRGLHSYPSALESGIAPVRDDAFLRWLEAHLSRLPAPGRRVLEVACHDGYILKALQSQGYEVTGCDPGPGADIAARHGLHVDRRFFDPGDYLERGMTFDLVIARHVVEHVPDPVAFIRSLSRVLAPGGRLLLETPDVEFHLRRGLPEVFSPQHMQGFSGASLALALEAADLRLAEMAAEGGNLTVSAMAGGIGLRAGRSPQDMAGLVAEFRTTLSGNSTLLARAVDARKARGGAVAVWGAGSFTAAAVGYLGLDPRRVDLLLDSDPAKHDRAYTFMDCPVRPPSEALTVRPGLLIVASMYAQDIARAVADMGLACDVLALYPKVSLLPGVQARPQDFSSPASRA